MFFIDLLFVIVIAFLLTGIFGAGVGRRRGYSGLWVFLIILVLATWAGGLWITPVGPALWGVNWLGFMLVGIAFALLLSAFLPPAKSPRTKKEAIEQAEAEEDAAIVLNVFFWVTVIGFAAAIILAYVV